MSAMSSQITSLTIVYSSVYSGADQRKHQSSASMAFARGIHRGPMNCPHKGPVTRKMFPFDDVIMWGGQMWEPTHWYNLNVKHSVNICIYICIHIHTLWLSHVLFVFCRPINDIWNRGRYVMHTYNANIHIHMHQYIYIPVNAHICLCENY